MDEKDKRKIVEFVGLEWIDYESCDRTCGGICHICDTPQLDPLDPADLYGKIWPAFEEKVEFFARQVDEHGYDIDIENRTPTSLRDLALVDRIGRLLTSPPNLAQALLEYIEGKEK